MWVTPLGVNAAVVGGEAHRRECAGQGLEMGPGKHDTIDLECHFAPDIRRLPTLR